MVRKGNRMLKILIETKALKSLKKLDVATRRAIDTRIEQLAKSPDTVQSKPLIGHAGLRRTRVGNYRIVYTINGQELLLIVVRIGHRKDVYRRL